MATGKRPKASMSPSDDDTSADLIHIRDNEIGGRTNISSVPESQQLVSIQEETSPSIHSPPAKFQKGEEGRPDGEILVQVAALPPAPTLNFERRSQGGGSSQGSISTSKMSPGQKVEYLKMKKRGNEKLMIVAQLEAENAQIYAEILKASSQESDSVSTISRQEDTNKS